MSVNDESNPPPEIIAVKVKQVVLHTFKTLKKVTVEPILFFSIIIIVMYSIVSSQYIYYRLSKNYGIENATETSECVSGNETNVTRELQNKITIEANQWNLYLNVAGFVPSFFSTVLMGTWGDKVGRRLPLTCNFIGYVFMLIMYIIVIHLELDIAYLLVARVACGIGGDFSAVLCSCYAYLADISRHNDRTLRVAIGEASTGLGSLFASLISGVWIAAQGFEPPLWFLFSVALAAIFYITVLLPEVVPRSNGSISSASTFEKFRSLFSPYPFTHLWKFLSENWDRTRKVLGVVVCFFLQVIIFDGVQDTHIIYVLSPPLCWSSTLIGYGSSLQDATYLFSLITIKLLNEKLSDIWLVFMSTLSNIGGLVTYAAASVTWVMFLGYTIGLLASTNAIILRSMVSRLVAKHEQGAAFALIACSESTASLVASFIFNGVYAATVSSFRGAVFLVGAGVQIIMFVFYSIVYQKTKSDLEANKAEEYHNFNTDLVWAMDDLDKTSSKL